MPSAGQDELSAPSQAEADIEAIALHIADDDPAAARRWYEDIYHSCRRIGEMPGLDIAKPDVRLGLRSLPVGNYLILYCQTEEGARIVCVVHGARQWEDLFRT